MMDTKSIKAGLFGYFQSLGYYEYRNGFMKGDCLECGAEDKAGVNIERNFYHCFRCEAKGSPVRIIQSKEGFPNFNRVLDFVKTFSSANYKPPKVEIYPELPVILPKGFKLMKYGDEREARIARNYMRRRGFHDMNYLAHRGVGFVGDKTSDYYGYIVFSYRRNRKVIYFQTRAFMDHGPKFKNPTVEDFGIGKNQVIYNENAFNLKEVHLVESVINALTLGDDAGAIQGKVLSDWQLKHILTSKCEVVNIMLDKDAWQYALEIAYKLVDYKKVRLIQFEDDRDVNDLGKDRVLTMKENTPILTTLNEILKTKWK